MRCRRRGASGGACRPSMPRSRRPSSSTTRRASTTTSRPASMATSSPSSWRPRGCPSPRPSSGSPAMAGVAAARVIAEKREQRGAPRATLHDVLELAAAFFEAQLQARAGAKARAATSPIAASRPRSQTQFRIGYAPAERYALRDHLAGKGVPREAMIEAGLLVRGEDIPVPYDRFRDRVMFPITDARGRVIAFGGRALEKDVAGQIPELAGDAALPQGRTSSTTTTAPARPRTTARHGHRGRGLCRRHRHDRAPAFPNTVAPLGTALTAGPARAALADGRRADPLLRRRQGRPPRRLSRLDMALPLIEAGQDAALRPAARRAGPRRSRRAPAGRRRCGEVLGAARCRSSTCSGCARRRPAPLDTPERRAALEQRLRERRRADPRRDLRRHYRAEMDDAAARACSRRRPPGRARRSPGRARQPWPAQGGAARPRPAASTPPAARPQCCERAAWRASPLFAARAAFPRGRR